MVKRSRRFVIFQGELTDAPGRMENWTEWLTHLGADDWQLSIEGTDFTGAGKAEPQSERFTTDKLLMWLQERDSETEPNRRVGGRLKALRAFAEKEKLVTLLNLIERVRRGTWPPRPPRPKVTAVTGVTLVATTPHPRAEHIKPYMSIETTRGPGIMSMPTSSSMFVQCWLGANPFWTESWKCRLSKSLASQVRERVTERLEREPEIAVRFFTIVIFASSIASKYRGGIRGFGQAYPSALQNSFLRAISIMSSGELEEFLEQMRQGGLIPGQDVAVGEMMHGEWIACPRIRFERRGEGLLPRWVATYDPMYEPSPNSGLQSDAARAPRA